MSDLVQCLPAVEVIEKHLQAIPHPTAGPNGASAVLRLVQFAHTSPGLQKLRRQIAEGLVMLLEKDPRIKIETLPIEMGS
jgi:hypothetical protein